jgi:hypothetical protein
MEQLALGDQVACLKPVDGGERLGYLIFVLHKAGVQLGGSGVAVRRLRVESRGSRAQTRDSSSDLMLCQPVSLLSITDMCFSKAIVLSAPTPLLPVHPLGILFMSRGLPDS